MSSLNGDSWDFVLVRTVWPRLPARMPLRWSLGTRSASPFVLERGRVRQTIAWCSYGLAMVSRGRKDCLWLMGLLAVRGWGMLIGWYRLRVESIEGSPLRWCPDTRAISTAIAGDPDHSPRKWAGFGCDSQRFDDGLTAGSVDTVPATRSVQCGVGVVARPRGTAPTGATTRVRLCRCDRNPSSITCLARGVTVCRWVQGFSGWSSASPEGYYEVESVAFGAAGFWAHRETHAQLQFVVRAVMRVTE